MSVEAGYKLSPLPFTFTCSCMLIFRGVPKILYFVLQVAVPSTSQHLDPVSSHENSRLPHHVDIAAGQFVAVYYSDTFYVGRILKQISSKRLKVQFLKKSGNSFGWPRKDDISQIRKKYILNCSVHFSSSVFPARLTNIDEIKKMYTDFKST